MCNVDREFFKKAEILRTSLVGETDERLREVMLYYIGKYYEADCSASCSGLEQKAGFIVNVVEQHSVLVKETIHMTENKTENKIIGSTISGSNINQGSSLYQVSQDITNAKSFASDSKKELYELMEKLLEELKDSKGVDTVVRRVSSIKAEIEAEEPDNSLLNVTAEGLVKAAKAVEGITSSALVVAGQIAAFILKYYPSC